MTVHIKSITISRGYQKDAPFKAKVSVGWDDKDTVMNVEVDEQRTLDIIKLVAPLIAEACAQEMADFAQLAQEAAQPLIEHESQSKEGEDATPVS